MDRIGYGKIPHADPATAWRDARTLVALTAGSCLLALVIALNTILNVPAERLTTDMLLFISILGGLATSYPLVTRRRRDLAVSHPGLWITLILTVTMAIIVLYAI